MEIKRGDIYYADLSPVVGAEEGGIRPVVIVSNNVINRYSSTVIATAITSRITKSDLPIHVVLNSGIAKDSVVLAEQVRTLDKCRLRECMGCVDDEAMQKIDAAILVAFGLSNA